MAREIKIAIQVGTILFSLILIKFFSTSPGTISGNGNPALLVIFPLLFILVSFALNWLKCLRELRLSKFIWVLILCISLVIIIFVFIHTIQAFNQFELDFKVNYENKYHRTLEPGLFELMTSGITIHTNYLYFNYLTFLAFVSLLNVVGASYRIAKPYKQVVQCTEDQDKTVRTDD